MEVFNDRTVAVGWLHPKHEYPRGIASPDFVARLAQFTRNWGKSIKALGWGAAGGFHECQFCAKPLKFRRVGNELASGTFGVPAGERIFYCPEMILHYITEHGYLPPVEFVVALMSCPVPGTAEYISAAQSFASRFD
jgi:hypothetical protein